MYIVSVYIQNFTIHEAYIYIHIQRIQHFRSLYLNVRGMRALSGHSVHILNQTCTNSYYNTRFAMTGSTTKVSLWKLQSSYTSFEVEKSKASL